MCIQSRLLGILNNSWVERMENVFCLPSCVDTARKEWSFDTQSIAAATYHNCQNPWYCCHRTYNRLLNNLAIPIAWRRCSNLPDARHHLKESKRMGDKRRKKWDCMFVKRENKSARTRKSLSSPSTNVCLFISPNSVRTSVSFRFHFSGSHFSAGRYSPLLRGGIRQIHKHNVSITRQLTERDTSVLWSWSGITAHLVMVFSIWNWKVHLSPLCRLHQFNRKRPFGDLDDKVKFFV